MSRPGPDPVLQASTRLGAVHLRVADLGRQVAFYQQALGLKVQRQDAASVSLGAGGEDLLVLTLDPQAQKPHRKAGLYHFCLAVPERRQLGWWLQRLLNLETPLQGLVDHRMAEAIYLQDAEGNGIELNWDRPRSAWPNPQELLRMGNGPLDVEGLLDANQAQPSAGLPSTTRVGHIHLHVGDLDASTDFYCGLVGLEKQMEIPGQAVFTSAGGYHHHVAYNLWQGRGIGPAPEHSLGLDHFSFHVSASDLAALRSRLQSAARPFTEGPAGLLVRDASANAVLFTA